MPVGALIFFIKKVLAIHMPFFTFATNTIIFAESNVITSTNFHNKYKGAQIAK